MQAILIMQIQLVIHAMHQTAPNEVVVHIMHIQCNQECSGNALIMLMASESIMHNTCNAPEIQSNAKLRVRRNA